MRRLFARYTLLLIVLLSLLSLPTLAQDPTADSSPVATLETAPVTTSEDTVPDAPVVLNMEAGSGDATINTSTTPPTTTPPVTVDTSNSVPTPIVIVGAIIFGLVFIGLLLNQQIIIKAVAPLSPPETTKAILDSMMPSLMSVFMNTVAATIPTDIDDKGFIEAARQRGLIVARGADGVYHTTRAPGVPDGFSPGPNLPTSGATTSYPDAG